MLLLMAAVKHLAGVPLIGEYGFTAAAAAQLYVPLLLIGHRGVTSRSLGLRRDRIASDLKWAGALMLITLIPYGLGHHFWQTIVGHRAFAFQWPDSLLSTIFMHLFVVAVAEEMFFRGYLQERFEQLWPPQRRLLGAPFGLAVVMASAVFALAHFVGEYQPDRLGPFFPALVFGWLRARTGSILSPILYHAFCNIFANILWASYRGGSLG